MADTAIKTEEEKKEYFDPPEVLDEKCEKLAMWIQSAEHFVAFTGAGISTSFITTVLLPGKNAPIVFLHELHMISNIKEIRYYDCLINF